MHALLSFILGTARQSGCSQITDDTVGPCLITNPNSDQGWFNLHDKSAP
jgi:hypothetical protein